jgi:hypothetical protein
MFGEKRGPECITNLEGLHNKMSEIMVSEPPGCNVDHPTGNQKEPPRVSLKENPKQGTRGTRRRTNLVASL